MSFNLIYISSVLNLVRCSGENLDSFDINKGYILITGECPIYNSIIVNEMKMRTMTLLSAGLDLSGI